MPELPDLQVFSRNLTKKMVGKTIKKVSVPYPKKLNVLVKELQENLEGQKLTKIFRYGKELHFEFNNGNVLALHLMLKGQLREFEEKNKHKYPIIELLFEDNSGLALTDFQGAATPTLNPEANEAKDALGDDVDYKFLKDRLNSSKATIKNFLLDQHNIRGIGNAYADEILWDARISPFSTCNKIPDEQVKALDKSIKKVLTDAENSILKTHPDIIGGEIRDFMNIHTAKKKSSPAGAAIIYRMVGGRKTYYTDEQELFKSLIVELSDCLVVVLFDSFMTNLIPLLSSDVMKAPNQRRHRPLDKGDIRIKIDKL
jgi:formamidopyrimidine-DNA glycosylase